MGIHDLQMKCRYSLFCTYLLSLVLVSPVSSATSASVMDVQHSDCVKCHAVQIKQMIADSGKHATEVACLDCHPRHLPESTETITSCDACHEGRPHYQIKDCSYCHMDAHRPMTFLRDPVKPARVECLSCHAEVGQEMTASYSQHARLFCNRCHKLHKDTPACMDCHRPHLLGQREDACSLCHQAHQPRSVYITRYVPESFCRACHEQQAVDLSVSSTRHGGINCIHCHAGQHGERQDCRDCHGLPHVTEIHRQHGDCLVCHDDAHRLISGR